MKTATTFHSDFFNTDCLIIDGQPYFSVTGATRTLYGNDGGASIKRFGSSLAKLSGVPTLSSTADLSKIPGIFPVLVERSGTGSVVAQAMHSDLFVELLHRYSEKDTKAGRYAKKVIGQMAKASMDLLLRRDAGLLSEKVAREIDEVAASRVIAQREWLD